MASSDQSQENSLEDLILFARVLMKRVEKIESNVALGDLLDLFYGFVGEYLYVSSGLKVVSSLTNAYLECGEDGKAAAVAFVARQFSGFEDSTTEKTRLDNKPQRTAYMKLREAFMEEVRHLCS